MGRGKTFCRVGALRYMRMRIPSALLLATVAGCSSFPVADVRHSHAEVFLVSGAQAIDTAAAGDNAGYVQKKTGFSHVTTGNRLVLVVQDSDSKPGWLDSGTAEVLVVEIPGLIDGARWAIGKESRAWHWKGSSWGLWPVGDLNGVVYLSRKGDAAPDLRIEAEGTINYEREVERVRLRHTFSASPIAFEEFRRRYPPQTTWTR
jgi:hypothetical protein